MEQPLSWHLESVRQRMSCAAVCPADTTTLSDAKAVHTALFWMQSAGSQHNFKFDCFVAGRVGLGHIESILPIKRY